jgi:hypothetical protein
VAKVYEPTEKIKEIQQVLVSDKKKIAFLFGAGTSFAPSKDDNWYIPAVSEMTDKIVELLRSDDKHGCKFSSAIEEIRDEFEQQTLWFNIETLLSNIDEKQRLIGKGTLNGLSKDEFDDMAKKIRKGIYDIVTIPNDSCDTFPLHCNFAKWIANADRKSGIEIFTTNYDFMFEIALEANLVPYYDGFTGSYKPFFNADSLEDLSYLPKQTKLWKIHGSLGLQKDDKTGQVIRVNSNSKDLLIYPSSLKYNDSKKQPYSAFMDRLNLFLKQDDAVLFVCGYSFNDEHINERILSALQTNTTAHVFVLYYSDNFNENDSVAKLALRNRKISVFANTWAIIGGQHGEWRIKDDNIDTNNYFRLDTKSEITADDTTEDTGKLLLPDFGKFVNFLKNMIPRNEWEEFIDE